MIYLGMAGMWKLLCFSCVNLDAMGVCGIIRRKWSCVFREGEMDKFSSGGDGDNAREFENEGLDG